MEGGPPPAPDSDRHGKICGPGVEKLANDNAFVFSLASSMPKRLRAVIQTGGDHRLLVCDICLYIGERANGTAKKVDFSKNGKMSFGSLLE